MLGAAAEPLCLHAVVSFTDDALLSGSATALGQSAWRWSPRRMGDVLVVSDEPATFRLAGRTQLVTPVPGARILHLPTASRADAGFWLLANGTTTSTPPVDACSQ